MNLFRKSLRKPLVLFGILSVAALMVVSAMQFPAFSSAGAQQNISAENVSEEELQSFVNASSRISDLQKQAEEEIYGLIEEHGLTGERYVEIVLKENDPETESDATEEERQKVEQISQNIESIDKDLHEKAVSVISEEGLTAEEYQTIAIALQSSSELQERYEALRG